MCYFLNHQGQLKCFTKNLSSFQHTSISKTNRGTDNYNCCKDELPHNMRGTLVLRLAGEEEHLSHGQIYSYTKLICIHGNVQPITKETDDLKLLAIHNSKTINTNWDSKFDNKCIVRSCKTARPIFLDNIESKLCNVSKFLLTPL